MESSVKERLIAFMRDKGISQKRFEESVGLSNGYINSLRHSPSVDKIQRILGAYPEINHIWLLTGEGEMYSSSTPQLIPADDGDSSGLPLIPIKAMAGALSGDNFSLMEHECEKYIVPVFKGAEFLIMVQGDSMMPKYMPGDIVACKRVPLSRLWFQWGKSYVIDTTQGALIKRIEPSEQEGCISIHSDNNKYKPFNLPVEEINGVALVVGTIRVE